MAKTKDLQPRRSTGHDVVVGGVEYGLGDPIDWGGESDEDDLSRFENSAIADAEPRRFFDLKQAIISAKFLRNVKYPPDVVFEDDPDDETVGEEKAVSAER